MEQYDPSELAKVRKISTPIEFAVVYGTFDDAQQILKDDPECLNHKFENGDSLLHLAVHQEKLEVVRLLLEAGADLNANGDHGRTPLYYAVHEKNYEIAKLLLAKGADPNKSDSDGYAPISYTVGDAALGENDFFKLLKENGAKIDLPVLMGFGDCSRVRGILKSDPDHVNKLNPKVRKQLLGDAISMICVYFSNEIEIRLRQKNIDLNSDEIYNFQLRKVLDENRDILDMLISQGAPRYISTNEIDMALAGNQPPPLVELMFEYGADFPAENDHRWVFIMAGRKFGTPNMDKEQIIDRYKRKIK